MTYVTTMTHSPRLPGRRRITAFVIVITAVLGVAACTADSYRPTPMPTTGSGQVAPHGWVTTTDRSRLLAPLIINSAPVSDPGPADITIDPSQVEQSIDGFGAALTHSSADVLARLPDEPRQALVKELFDPSGPVRMSMLRIPIGASDFVPSQAFTLDDVPPGQSDWALDRFSTAADEQHLQPLLRQILAINPHLKIIASPWSPPGWLKTPTTLQGGQLLDEQRAYDTYARYLVEFVQKYQASGIPIWALTLQNEPQLRHPNGYPGLDLPVAGEARLIEALGPALQATGLTTKLLGFDHNWSLHPADAAATPAGRDPEYQYPADLLRTPAGSWLAGTAFHCYSGAATAQSQLHAAFPDKGIWVTECSGSKGLHDPPAKVFADSLHWQATTLLIPALRNWGSAVMTFNLALDPDGGPHVGGCDTCTPVVTVNPETSVTRNADYYLLAHAGLAAQPGAVQVTGQARPGLPVSYVALRNPDGHLALLAYNDTDQETKLSIADPHSRLTTSLPAHSLTTVIW